MQMAERGHTRVPTQFTCITCRLIFEDSNAQREHHKSQLHLFNSKRKIVGLQPVSTEAFEKKLSGLLHYIFLISSLIDNV